MKKKMLFFVFILGTFTLSACKTNGNKDSDESHSTNNLYGSIEAEWPTYSDAHALAEKSNVVFTGKIIGIDFQMLNIKTAEPATKDTEIKDAMLYTIYDVEVSSSYKGSVNEIANFRIEGGLMDYRVEEQLSILEEYSHDYIPIMEHNVKYDIGET